MSGIEGEFDPKGRKPGDPDHIKNSEEILKIDESFLSLRNSLFLKENTSIEKIYKFKSINRVLKGTIDHSNTADPDLEALMSIVQGRDIPSKCDKVVDDLIIREVKRGLECGCIHCRTNASSVAGWYLGK